MVLGLVGRSIRKQARIPIRLSMRLLLFLPSSLGLFVLSTVSKASGVDMFYRSVNNKIGARLTLFIGSLGYGLYIASYL